MAKTLNACIFARVCFEALQITQSHKDNIHAHILFEQISFTRKVSLTPAHQQESHKCFVNIRLTPLYKVTSQTFTPVVLLQYSPVGAQFIMLNKHILNMSVRKACLRRQRYNLHNSFAYCIK